MSVCLSDLSISLVRGPRAPGGQTHLYLGETSLERGLGGAFDSWHKDPGTIMLME